MIDYQQYTDEQLIQFYREGESYIMDYLLSKYKSLVRNKTRSLFLIGGDRDDLIQEGMIGLMKAVRDYQLGSPASFSSFATLCITRQIYTAIEASQRNKHIPLNTYVSLNETTESIEPDHPIPLMDTLESKGDIDPEDIFIGKEFTTELLSQLQHTLSKYELQVLYLHLMGSNTKIISSMLGKSEKSVINAIQRCKNKTELLLKSSIDRDM